MHEINKPSMDYYFAVTELKRESEEPDSNIEEPNRSTEMALVVNCTTDTANHLNVSYNFCDMLWKFWNSENSKNAT